jgi:hypothetical protein
VALTLFLLASFLHRLVTLSFAPFLIVHINSAYTRMTGLSPANVLGKAFHEVIHDKAFKTKAAKASSLARLHKETANFVNKKGTDSHGLMMEVAVVKPDGGGKDRKSMTHCVISLQEDAPAQVVAPPSSATIKSNNSGMQIPPPRDTLMNSVRLHCGVMG